MMISLILVIFLSLPPVTKVAKMVTLMYVRTQLQLLLHSMLTHTQHELKSSCTLLNLYGLVGNDKCFLRFDSL